ncbi:WAP four-disulfide core domain protein 1-like isoform X2 [Limulus polyphemus]|uniref:WAP four-disulfide core domain protein 1-like isoform X2 n=1 Tax=Limulus polyphemus TaxID=6850 RepID=A0ABM1S7T5_LIMPO|nr:WAP four-disulfide core domain protein 1-like isoform X2 [Limulus polyphemus]
MRMQLGITDYGFIDLFLRYLVFIWISRVEFAHGSGDKATNVSEKLHLDSSDYDFSFFEDISNEGLREHMTQLLKDPSLRDCPTPVLPIARVYCSQTLCSSHEDCPDPDFKCCFNGCVFSCQHKIPPPPVIDWQEEPKGVSAIPIYPDNLRNMSDFSSPEVKVCSTSPLPPPSVSLDCPANYVCRIQYIEDPLEGVPNLGVCVPVTFGESSVSDDGKTYLEKAGKETERYVVCSTCSKLHGNSGKTKYWNTYMKIQTKKNIHRKISC